tara:strand:- start:372 stop:1331 length:960 start_codon:yes stop_codon:yes gene_type:complete
MPQLEVEIVKNFRLGKYGSSFVDIYDPPKEKRRLVFTTQIVEPLFKDEPLVCKPNLNRISQRPAFAIERGNIPQFDCDVPEALQRELDFVLGKRKSIQTDPFLKEESDFNDEDIRNSRNFGAEFNSVDTLDKMVAVGGLQFSVINPKTRRPYERGAEVHWSFGLNLGDVQDSCGGSGVASGGEGFDPPVLLTDNRNREGINLASRESGRGLFFWSNSRVYFEIRHGLNSDKYHASVTHTEAGVGVNAWQKTPKKKSFVLSKSNLRRNGSFSRGFFGGFSNPWSSFPSGKITVVFFADPCDYTIENQSGLPANERYVGTS